MKLTHEEIISKFEKHPFHSQDGKGMDAEVLVKYFNPCGTGTWLITEAEREGDDWRLFGYCHIYGMGVGLPNALRAGISSSAVRTYHRTRHLHGQEIRPGFSAAG